MEIEKEIKQSKFESDLHKAIVNILYTASWLQDRQKPIFEQFGITAPQYNVLRILKGKHPRCASASEIKEVMLDKNPDLTRICDRLVEKKLVTRELNPDNRRQVEIRITQDGLKLLKALHPLIAEKTSDIKITDKEAKELSALLDKLRG